jgi:pimeloyl-ACP methyl ester carboxylesterase
VTGRTQQEVWDSLGDYDLRPALADLRLPAIVLHGDDDPIPVESARAVAAMIGAPFHLLADCGHVPYVEAFDEFRRLLDGFLPA